MITHPGFAVVVRIARQRANNADHSARRIVSILLNLKLCELSRPHTRTDKQLRKQQHS